MLQLPSITVKGHPVQVGGVRKSAHRLRLFYLPYYVPITVITSQLVQKGVKVIKTFQEKDRETGLASNVWNVLVEVDSKDKVPDRMWWLFAGMQGGILVNMVGEPPKCLRCLQREHIKFQCTAPYCHKCREVGHEQSDDCRPTRLYASLVHRSEPADQDDMDDPAETNVVTMDDQPTTSQSCTKFGGDAEHGQQVTAGSGVLNVCRPYYNLFHTA